MKAIYTSAIQQSVLTRMGLLCVAVTLLIASLSGCGSGIDGASTPVVSLNTKQRMDHADLSFDAGVVFAGQRSYLCLPLRSLGITESDEILAVRSSCDCVTPSVVRFHDPSSNTSRGLQLDFEHSSDEYSEATPIRLAVEVTFQLADGRSTTATIRFLHTVRAPG